jgi:glycosyltransferase 2 family protein
VAWIRNTGEPPERRPTDYAWLVVGSVGAAVVGIWAQSQSAIDLNIYKPINDLSDALDGPAKVFLALGSIFSVAVVAVLLLVFRQIGVAWRVALAGGLAWGVAKILNDILPAHTISGVHINVRLGDGPVYPTANVAAIAAAALVLAPYAVRPLKRIFLLFVVLAMFSAMYLGLGYPSDVLGGFLLGIAAGALVLVIFGSPAGRPTIGEVRDALGDLGYDVADLQYAQEHVPRASVVDVTLASGERLRVDAFGRDQRDAQVVAKAWHAAMYHEPGLPVFGSRIQQAEHVGYTLMLAERAGVHASRLVKTGVGGPDAAMVVTEPPSGTPLAQLAPEQVTFKVLAAVWEQLHKLHAAGISHGNLDPSRILVAADGTVAFDDFTSADASGEEYWLDRDVVAVLVGTALIVGNDQATAPAVNVLGSERVGAVIPMVQPAALPDATGKGVKHLSKALKELRGDLVTATGVGDAPPLKIKRLSWTNIGMLIGILFALYLAIPALEGVDWATVQKEFENATWGWAVAAYVVYPLVPMAWATALMGCVNTDLAFFPTVITQVSCNSLTLITPNGIGGTALQLDYLHKQGVPVASGGSAMVLSTGVGGAIQMILFLIAASITSTSIDTSSSSGSTSLLAIAVVAALIGIVLWIPKVRNKVVPAVKRALTDIWAVVRNPKKGLQLVGGDLAGNLLYPAILGLCLLAFGVHLPYAELVVIQIGAGMLGSVAPVPGGIGVQEAALTALMTSFGVSANVALATVIVYRGITFVLPAIYGFFTLRWMRAKGYA